MRIFTGCRAANTVQILFDSPDVNAPASCRPGPAQTVWSRGADAAGPGCSICFASTGWREEEGRSAASSVHCYHQGLLEVHLINPSKIANVPMNTHLAYFRKGCKNNPFI